MMHINEAIARIIGEEAKHYSIQSNGAEVAIRDTNGIETITAASLGMSTISTDCDIVPIYHAYSTDANEALRALKWLAVNIKGEYADVGYNKDTGWYCDADDGNMKMESPCYAICDAVISFSKKTNLVLLDYDAIEWNTP